ncbi:YybH family protein [Aquiflexum gelatinilyticum]|uniref:Nuclear transport factor 2 family protein n=1 Tax=Aquiflexum gelatinilyticum TaxID=2961943 RepID=A0A9X2P9Z9_9BACT|nr:nuclear transport factor 2 family protein [Aquiflexum gelatinilyticum]MCR9017083.1 nuclear transport factor 2 family protein [Aquiflexum gelatinilyticum]
MNMKNYFRIATACFTLSLFTVACSSPAPEEAVAPEEMAPTVAPGPDMAAIKAEIQTLEDAWGAADNSGDVNALIAFYADDAVSMGSGSPMAVGKAAIQKEIQESMASRPAGTMVKYEVLDVFGDENTITEVGKTTRMDASGKVTSSGKYMAIWEKRDGKYVCIRDISNNDSKEN